MQCNAMQCNTIQYNTIKYNTIQYNTIQYNKIQYNTIQYNTIQYNTIQYNTIQYNTIHHKSGCENSETGERYREAQTWTEDEGCTECICEKSGPACSTVDCLEPDCEEGYVIGTKPGKCCPGCKFAIVTFRFLFCFLFFTQSIAVDLGAYFLTNFQSLDRPF